jgi:hypothetical protein
MKHCSGGVTDRFDNARMIVPENTTELPGVEVNVSLARGVPNERSLRARDY